MKRIISLIICLALFTVPFAITATAEDDKITVNFSVYEQVNNKYLLWEPQYQTDVGATVLTVLADSGLEYKESAGYVTEIDGFAQSGYGANSGWTFTVNGDRPSVSAANYILNDGDRINWVYVTEFEVSTTVSDTATPTNQSQSSANESVSNTVVGAVTDNTSASVSGSVAESTTATTAKATKNNTVAKAESTLSTTVPITDYVSPSLKFLKSNNTSYTPLVLSLYKQAISNDIKEKLVEEAAKDSLETTEVERLIINLSAIGMSPKNVDGVDLQEALLNSTSVMKSGLNGAIFGLYAYEHCEISEEDAYENTSDDFVTMLLQNQNEDGGFSLTYGEESDVDITAGVLSALAPYKAKSSASAAVDKAILWLLNVQNKDGSFNNSYGEASCESTAQALIALKTLGISIDDERFVKEQNVYDALLGFFGKNGFAHTVGGEDNALATEQALLAIYAYNNSVNPYTETVSTHIDELNFRPFFGIALAVIVIAAVALIILKKKGILSAALSENEAARQAEQEIIEQREREKAAKKRRKGKK